MTDDEQRMWDQRAEAARQVAEYASRNVYGEHRATIEENIARTTETLERINEQIAALDKRLDRMIQASRKPPRE